jgi:hypothetical protein
MLHLEIVSAKNLRDVVGGRLTGNKSCPFVRVEVGGVKVDTEIIKNKLNPVWDESIEIVDHQAGTDIQFSVWHPAVKKKPEICLGTAILEAKSFEANGFDSELKLKDTGLKKGDSLLKIKVSWAERAVAPNNGRISAYNAHPPVMWIVRFRAIGLRLGPGVHEERTKIDLTPGEEFAVVETISGANNQQFLRLEDGRGWAFTKSVKDGEMLCEKLEDTQQVVEDIPEGNDGPDAQEPPEPPTQTTPAPAPEETTPATAPPSQGRQPGDY